MVNSTPSLSILHNQDSYHEDLYVYWLADLRYIIIQKNTNPRKTYHNKTRRIMRKKIYVFWIWKERGRYWQPNYISDFYVFMKHCLTSKAKSRNTWEFHSSPSVPFGTPPNGQRKLYAPYLVAAPSLEELWVWIVVRFLIMQLFLDLFRLRYFWKQGPCFSGGTKKGQIRNDIRCRIIQEDVFVSLMVLDTSTVKWFVERILLLREYFRFIAIGQTFWGLLFRKF